MGCLVVRYGRYPPSDIDEIIRYEIDARGTIESRRETQREIEEGWMEGNYPNGKKERKKRRAWKCQLFDVYSH